MRLHLADLPAAHDPETHSRGDVAEGCEDLSVKVDEGVSVSAAELEGDGFGEETGKDEAEPGHGEGGGEVAEADDFCADGGDGGCGRGWLVGGGDGDEMDGVRKLKQCKGVDYELIGEFLLQKVPAKAPPTKTKKTKRPMGEGHSSVGIQRTKQKMPHTTLREVARLMRPKRSEDKPTNGRPSICPRFSNAETMVPCCADRPMATE